MLSLLGGRVGVRGIPCRSSLLAYPASVIGMSHVPSLQAAEADACIAGREALQTPVGCT